MALFCGVADRGRLAGQQQEFKTYRESIAQLPTQEKKEEEHLGLNILAQVPFLCLYVGSPDISYLSISEKRWRKSQFEFYELLLVQFLSILFCELQWFTELFTLLDIHGHNSNQGVILRVSQVHYIYRDSLNKPSQVL